MNKLPTTDLAARVAMLERRCDGLLSMVQALQAARGEELLRTNAKMASHCLADYDLNAPFGEPQR